jgi:hypothetical protein
MVFEYMSRKAVLDNDGTTLKERFTEDTDQVVLPQHLFELCLKWMLRKEKKLEYAAWKDDYDEELAKARGNLVLAKPIAMNGKARRSVPRYPQTGWGS